jgi:hypothetical protein
MNLICDLKYNNGFLALPICSIRIHGRCRSRSINGDHWLVMDHDDRRFFHISAHGKFLKTNEYSLGCCPETVSKPGYLSYDYY